MEYIYEAHDMIPKTFCRELIEKFDRDSRKAEGLTKGGTVLKIKKCTDLKIESYADWKLECNRIDKAFRTALSEYIRNLKLNVFGEDKLHIVDQLFNNPNITRSRFLMGRYGVGGHFNWHIDQNPITLNIGDANCERLFRGETWNSYGTRDKAVQRYQAEIPSRPRRGHGVRVSRRVRCDALDFPPAIQ